MKLEIKHLAPYLPYGLKVEHEEYRETYKGEKRIAEIVSLSSECVTLDNTVCDYYFDDKEPECNIKPILRPLSDLTKEEKTLFHNELRNTNTDNILPEINASGITNWYHSMRDIEITIWLFKNHFDVFGLIDNGLAIDKNTI